MRDPIKYAPQYGGYCAGEVVAGSVTVDIDPEAFKIIDGKLYLIYDKAHADDFAAQRQRQPAEDRSELAENQGKAGDGYCPLDQAQRFIALARSRKPCLN